MDQETFRVASRSWSMVLSDGTTVQVKVDDNGNPLPLAYEDRMEYAAKVREIRMSECDKQVSSSLFYLFQSQGKFYQRTILCYDQIVLLIVGVSIF